MIHVERQRDDEHGRRIEPDADWFERAEALTREALETRCVSEASKSHCAHDHVKLALEKLFRGKCAYCENHLGEAWEVDHFRPKARVAERADHPGYYWLACVWTNLYPACTHCNQRRKDRPHWDSPTGGPARGKYDQFPLEDEATRAMSHQDSIESEVPLLLDPCRDDPSEHLRYSPNGEIWATPNYPLGAFGKKTIEVCHLDRKRLTGFREQKVARLLKLLRLRARVEREDATELVQQWIDEELAPESPFAGLAQALVADPDSFGG